MKHLQLMHILMFVAIGLMVWPAQAELTAYQNLASSASVGQMVTVTVMLTYNGQNSTGAVVTPILPAGVVAYGAGQSVELYPGITQSVSYAFAAQQSGSYWIVSDISWEESGYWRSLRLEAPFSAVSTETGPQSSATGAGSNAGDNGSGIPQGSDPMVPPAGPTGVPDSPYNDTPPDGTDMPDGGYPGDMPQPGSAHMPGQESEPHRGP